MDPSTKQSPAASLHSRANRISEAYGVVLLLTLAALAVISWLPDGPWARMADVAATACAAYAGLASSRVSNTRLNQALVVSAVAIVFSGVAAASGRSFIGFGGAVLVAALLLTTQATILSRVVIAQSVGYRTILGALSAYTMMGLLFTYVYLATSLAQGTPFLSGTDETTMNDLVFFSYTTLTTTGYGNLLPAGEPGETFAVLEMLIGQIFLVTLVARLVSLWEPSARVRNTLRDKIESQRSES